MNARILIAGAPTGCWTNAGDEAVLQAMARDLREAAPGADLAVVSSNPPGTLHGLGLREVPHSDIPVLIEAARESDLMVLGGGGVFFDYWGFDPATILTSRHEGLAFYGGFGLLARLVGTPLMIYGAGVGPLRSEAARSFTRWVFEQAAVATLRDQASLRVVGELGADTSRVQVTADPAFGWAGRATGPAQLPPALAGSPRPLIGVALREWDTPGAPWERAVAAALDALRAAHGGTIVFVPLHRTVAWPLTDDEGVAERVHSSMRPGAAVVVPAERPLAEKVALLQACDLVLAMRLHAAVFAASAGVATVGLAYDPKVTAVFDELQAADWSVPLAEAARLDPLLRQAFARREELGAQLLRSSARLARAARENAELAAGLLTDRRRRPARDAVLAEAALAAAARLYAAERAGAAGGADAPAARASAQEALIASLQGELRRIRGSRGWALLERVWRVRRWIAPAGSRRERALGLAARAQVESGPQPEAAPSPPAEPVTAGLAEALARARDTVRVEPATQRPAPGGLGRVALLTNRLLDWNTREPRFGGAERYALGLGRLLRRLGFEVSFYQAATGAAFEGDYFGFPVAALPRRGHLAEFEFGVGEAFHEATRGHEHVLYAMPNYGSGPMREDAVLVCHGIWFDHDLLPPPFTFRTPEWFEHLYRVFSRPRKVVSVDTNSINVLRALWPEVGPRLTYLPNAVDTRVFKPAAARAAAAPTVLFPRRSDVIRGSRILGPILQGIPHRWRMRWVGDGDGEEPEVVRAVARRDPRLEVFSASFEQMPGLYQEAEICVIPSLASEGTSLACLEALASGCAVVATDVGGLPDLVQPGVNGLLVDPEPAAIAEAITFLIEHPEERHRLQKAGRETAHSFRLELWEQRWTSLLEDLGWLPAARPLPRAEGL